MGALDDLPLLDSGCRTKQDTTDIVFFQVHHNGHRAVFKFEELVCLGITKTIDAGNTVAHGKHGAHLVEFLAVVYSTQLLKQHFTDFTRFYFI